MVVVVLVVAASLSIAATGAELKLQPQAGFRVSRIREPVDGVS